MTTENDWLKFGLFAENATCFLSACIYDAYPRMLNRYTDANGSAIYPADLSTIALWRRWKRLRAGGGFSIDNAGHDPYSCTVDTTTWYAYDYDVRYYGYRYERD